MQESRTGTGPEGLQYLLGCLRFAGSDWADPITFNCQKFLGEIADQVQACCTTSPVSCFVPLMFLPPAFFPRSPKSTLMSQVLACLLPCFLPHFLTSFFPYYLSYCAGFLLACLLIYVLVLTCLLTLCTYVLSDWTH